LYLPGNFTLSLPAIPNDNFKVKYKHMKDRILQFLESEKMSPAEFADKIGVQRSSMSHILNGRNYPSASFIQKMLQAYPLLDSRWLMIGVGSMNLESGNRTEKSQSAAAEPLLIREAVVPGNSGSQAIDISETDTEFPFIAEKVSIKSAPHKLLDQEEATNSSFNQPGNQPDFSIPSGSSETPKADRVTGQATPLTALLSGEKEIEQVLFFFKDKTFSLYRPS
jgi:transcriptional regulator with XRE-family HTH domain